MPDDNHGRYMNTKRGLRNEHTENETDVIGIDGIGVVIVIVDGV